MKTVCFSVFALVAITLSALAAPPAKKKGGKKKDDKIDAPTLIKKFDTDGDMKLDKTELHEALKVGMKGKTNIFSVKSGAMEKFDEDKDGKLDEKELAKLLAAEPKDGSTTFAEVIVRFF